MKKILSLILTLAMVLSSAVFLLPAGAGADGYDASEVFVDVPADAWFKSAVDFVGSRGIMGGAGQADTFKPSDLSTRSMVAVILHRLEGEPAASASSPFTDLTQDWYVAAADWAYESGVVKGSSATTFNPDGKVTRQELVTMLYRYAGYCGLDVSDKASSADFPDSADVASWALESVEWALGAGLINGRKDGGNTVLAPMGNTQRSEMATILSRFITKLEENGVDPLYSKADALASSHVCDPHKASIHLQLGNPADVTEAEISAMIVSALGLDPSIYSVTLASGGYKAFTKAYSAVKNGEFAVIPMTFDINNLRTAGESASLSSVPVAVRRNDWYSTSRVIACDEGTIKDEMLNLELEEFDSLYLCREHGVVHIEAEALTEASFKEAIIGLMSRGAQVYKAQLVGDGFAALKSDFDKLSVGGSTTREVSFAISNELIKKECGKESLSDTVSVKFSVTKAEETTCGAVECPYDAALRATELFMDKYVCNEHTKAHVALKSGTKGTLSQMEALVKEALDLGGAYTVKLDSSAWSGGKVKAKITHAKGYEIAGPEFTPVYTTDSSSAKAAKFILCDNEKDAYKLIVHDGYSGNTGYGAWNYGQSESGWLLDTRADDAVRHGTINDVSIFNSSQVIREVNTTTTGVVNFRSGITITSGFNGAVLDFRNAAGESIMRLQTKDGAWKLLQADGSYTTVYTPAGEMKFVFDLRIDLNDENVSIVINDKDCETFALSETGVNANIQSLRFSSTDEDKVTFNMDLCDASVNYSLWEYFADHHLYSTLPQGWEYDKATISRNTGVLSDTKFFDHYVKVEDGGYIGKSFTPTDGKVIVQFSILPTVTEDGWKYILACSGDKTLFEVSIDDTGFYVNGEKAYDYVKNVWYYFYLLCDTETGKIELKINGIDRGEFELKNKHLPFDGIYASGGSGATYDQFMVYRDVYHSDYVPEPVKPAGEENYVVGMNTCSMWQNGFHGGWECISAYEETRPILGYYDEGNPETADWEIKYMVEHGVDFQSFVMFASQESGPLTSGLAMHLEDGYKYAKYKDMLDYCLIWCSASPNAPMDMDNWKNYYVPYFIEYHFKDPSYLVLDNMPVVQTFRFIDSWGSPYWTAEKRREALDYLDDEVRKLGYDGVLWITEDVSYATTPEVGYEGLYSYNHGSDCTSSEYLKAQISFLSDKADGAGLYYVPTSAIGFNCMGWMNERTPLMSVEEFRKSNEWIRDEYFKSDANCPDWAKNLTFVCTWNEYGEGHYLMPCEGLVGFGYLDVLRETFTSEKASDAVNIAPTEAQLERINRLYPQHLRALRAQERPTYTNGIYDKIQLTQTIVESVEALDLEKCVISKADNVTVSNGVVSCDTGKRGAVMIKIDSKVELSRCAMLELDMYIPEGSGCQLNAGNGGSDDFKSTFSKILSGTGARECYTLGVGAFSDFNNTSIKFNLPTGAKIYGIRLAANVRTLFSHTLNFMGMDIPYKVMPEMSPRGEYLFGFDSIFTDLHLFGMFAEWDNEARSLKLSFPNGDVIVYTVGSSVYNLNGFNYSLGYKLHETDGVPMIPLNMIVERCGYKIDYSDFTAAKITK